jgi:hypothetical protein
MITNTTIRKNYEKTRDEIEKQIENMLQNP